MHHASLPVADGTHGHHDGGVVLVLLLQVVPRRVVGIQVPQAGHVLEGRDQRLQLAVLVLLWAALLESQNRCKHTGQ